jgi:hypothetical protein
VDDTVVQLQLESGDGGRESGCDDGDDDDEGEGEHDDDGKKIKRKWGSVRVVF